MLCAILTSTDLKLKHPWYQGNILQQLTSILYRNRGEAKTNTEEEGEDTLNPMEEANMRRMFYSRMEKDSKPSFSDMQGDDPGRRPSITVYQSVDDDHPDLQSIQSIVANMNFSAD